MPKMMRVAVVGSGVSGLAAAYVLAKEGVEVVVYEKEDFVGGDAKIATLDDEYGTALDYDLGFINFMRATHPDVIKLFESVGVDLEVSDVSFSVSLDEGRGYEWGTRNGLSSFFAQRMNVFNPWFWKMMREIIKFKNDAYFYLEELENNPEAERNETLANFVQLHGYSELFQKAFLIPICASLWSNPSGIFDYPLARVRTSRWRSQSYVEKITKELESKGCQLKTNSEVNSVMTNEKGCVITNMDGLEEAYDECIITTHAPDALKILGKQATFDELRILGAFRYISSLLEEGGTVFTFEGTKRNSALKVTLRVHSPQFYWKVAIEAEIGFAKAYINGDISFVDKNKGLFKFLRILKI